MTKLQQNEINKRFTWLHLAQETYITSGRVNKYMQNDRSTLERREGNNKLQILYKQFVWHSDVVKGMIIYFIHYCYSTVKVTLEIKPVIFRTVNTAIANVRRSFIVLRHWCSCNTPRIDFIRSALVHCLYIKYALRVSSGIVIVSLVAERKANCRKFCANQRLQPKKSL